MNRKLFALNVLLAICLLVAIALQGRAFLPDVAFARNTRSLLQPEDIVVTPLGQRSGQGEGFRLVFPEAMVRKDEIWKVPKKPLFHLEPATEIQCAWRSVSVLEVRPSTKFESATRYKLRFVEGLVTQLGKRLSTDLELFYRSRSLRLLGVSAEESKDEAHKTAVLAFDMPVDRTELENAVSVLDGRGESLGFELEAVEGEGDRCFRLTVSMPDKPVPALALRKLYIKIRRELCPKGKDVAMGKAELRVLVLRKILFLGALRHRRNGLHLDLGRRNLPMPERVLISVEPKLPFQVLRSWNGFSLTAPFPPGEIVKVTLYKGFPGKGVHRIERDVERIIRIPDLPPAIRFSTTGRVFSSLARREIEVIAVNTHAIKVEVRALYPNNIVHLSHASTLNLPGHAFAAWKSKVYPLALQKNQELTRRIDVSDLLGASKRGFYQIRLTAKNADDSFMTWRAVDRLFQITDLGVTLRAGKGGLAIRVQSLAKGTPVEAAEIQILTPSNQVLASGRSGKDGVLMLRYKDRGKDFVPHVIDVRKDGDRSLIDLRSFRVELVDDTLAGRAFLDSGNEAWISFARGIHRPGETVRANIIVRDVYGLAPKGLELEVRWYSPNGRRVKSQRLVLPPRGLETVSLATRLSSPTGAWRLQFYEPRQKKVIGQGVFRVEPFVPDRMEAVVESLEPMRFGVQATLRVRANWLEGSPAAKRPCRLFVRFDHGKYEPAGFEGYSFSRIKKNPPPGALPMQRFVLDEKGEAILRFDVPRTAVGAQVLTARVSVEVEDSSGRAVRAVLRAPVTRPDHQLGLALSDDTGRIVLLDHSGQLLSGHREVLAVFERRFWTWQRRARPGGGYRYESRIASEELATRKVIVTDGRAEIVLDPFSSHGNSDWYVLVVKYGNIVVSQRQGSVPAKPDRLRVQSLGHAVLPGEKARLAIDSPFGGKAFVTLEGHGIHGYKVVDVKRGHTEFEVTVPANYPHPNLHAVVTLTRPHVDRPGAKDIVDGPFWIIGGSSIAVAHEDRRIETTLAVQEVVLPESEVTVHLLAPGARAATIALVDEGVLRLTGHADPDPFAFFQAMRRLDSLGADTGVALYRKPRYDPGVLAGGGGGGTVLGARLEGSTSSLIRPLTLFKGVVQLNGEGIGEYRFKLPPYEGRLRAMVIVAGTDAVGASSAAVTVRSPLGLMVASPRMLAPGDESGFVVTLRNNSGKEAELQLAIAAKGGLALLNPSLTLAKYRLADGKSKDLFVPFRAAQSAGPQGIVCTLRLADLERVVKGETLVRSLAQYMEERIGLAINGKRTIKVPGVWRKGMKARLQLDSDPNMQILPALEALLRYPYGCIEQTTSSSFALLASASLLSRLYPDGSVPQIDSMLEAAVDRIFSMQNDAGGMSWWPGGGREYPYGTVYALDFLLAASATGQHVDAVRMERLITRAEQLLRRSQRSAFRVMAVQVLSKAGRPMASWLDLLAAEIELPEDYLRLADTFARLGRMAGAKKLLQRFEKAKTSSSKREQSGLLRSSLRLQALELKTRLVLNPGADRIAELGFALATAMARPKGLTTQEQSQALRALLSYYRVSGGQRRAARVVLRIGGRKIQLGERSAIDLDLKGGDELFFDSTGPLYGQLELRGFRTDLEETSIGGLSMKREIRAVESGELVQSFKKGQIYEVSLSGVAEDSLENFLVTDTLPGGFELERDRTRPGLSSRKDLAIDRLELRDDRILFFHSGRIRGKFQLHYRMRAVFPGVYQRGALTAEALYDPGKLSRSDGGGRVRIDR